MSMRKPAIDDRLAARERPAGPPAMYQAWRRLLFLHWAVEPAGLSKHLPDGLHLDLHDDRAWLGIVPFFMCGVRPRGLPAVPVLSNFLELNVRTYVHDDNGVPGVWFFSLDASNRIACAIARSRFHLPYHHANMSASDGGWIDYHAQRRGTATEARFRYRGTGTTQATDPGTLEFFLVERYLLFAHDAASGCLFSGRVHHQPYQVQSAEVEEFSTSPLVWDGLALPPGPPHHACYSHEAVVEIFPLRGC